MEIKWVQKRIELWRLLQEEPQHSIRQLARRVGLSPSCVHTWKTRLRNVDGTDHTVFISRSRRRQTSPRRVTEAVETKILHLRDTLTTYRRNCRDQLG